MSEHFDVLIVGAGLSGIGTARHLQLKCPKKSFAIVETRDCLGGTWELFRYPGIRSDSDMHTMGYSFRPWTDEKAIADGATILKYLEETAHEYGIDETIRFKSRVVGASWSSSDALWSVSLQTGPEKQPVMLTCDFLHICSGYYNYKEGYTPDFIGADLFQGHIIHPQQWPKDVDYAGKRVVVIGSGATAVTLLPTLAKLAQHVTMLQRSPTYIVALPAKDKLANRLQRRLPTRMAYWLIRWKNILLGMFFYRLAKRDPMKVSAAIIGGVQAHLGPDYDVATHFTPRYKPWDQRLCVVPDGDLFSSIREGRASIVTDQIDSFTATGVRLQSGKELAADIIVTATGLKLQLISGITLEVDGKIVDLAQKVNYKGTMFSDVPNLAVTVGYTNASWTLKAELVSHYVCRLLNYMDRRHYRSCVPRASASLAQSRPLIDFTSSYIQRSLDQLPKQGIERPWKLHQNYPQDVLTLRYGKLNDKVLEFSR